MTGMKQETDTTANPVPIVCLLRQTHLTFASLQTVVPSMIGVRVGPAAVLVPRSAFSAATEFAGTRFYGALGTKSR